MPSPRFLTALPVFDEVQYVNEVLDLVKQYSDEILVVDDGSTDGTTEQLQRRDDVRIVTHAENQGYGAALRTAFKYALEHDFEIIVTIDCDGNMNHNAYPNLWRRVPNLSTSFPAAAISLNSLMTPHLRNNAVKSTKPSLLN